MKTQMPTKIEKGFIYTIKRVYWELQSANTRFQYIQFFLGELPGYLGLLFRKKVYSRCFCSCGEELTVFTGVRIRNPQNLHAGSNVFIGLNNSFDAAGGLTIGDRVLLGPSCKIWTINHVFEDPDTPIMEQGAESKPVIIGSDSWLAANVFIMPGTELSEGCVVTAGSVVGAKKYPAYSIIAGNPARVIGNRKNSKLTTIAQASKVETNKEQIENQS